MKSYQASQLDPRAKVYLAKEVEKVLRAIKADEDRRAAEALKEAFLKG